MNTFYFVQMFGPMEIDEFILSKKNNCQSTNKMMGMLSKALTSVSGNEPSVSMSAGANVLLVTILNKSSL